MHPMSLMPLMYMVVYSKDNLYKNIYKDILYI